MGNTLEVFGCNGGITVNLNTTHMFIEAIETLAVILQEDPQEILDALKDKCLISEEEAGDIMRSMQ